MAEEQENTIDDSSVILEDINDSDKDNKTDFETSSIIDYVMERYRKYSKLHRFYHL